jgi:hypothetical protein
MPPTYTIGGRVLQLLRGASWNNNLRNCRSAYRNHNQPDNANNNVGFRVVCLPQYPSPSEPLQGIPTGAPEGSQTRGSRPAPAISWSRRLIRTAPGVPRAPTAPPSAPEPHPSFR